MLTNVSILLKKGRKEQGRRAEKNKEGKKMGKEGRKTKGKNGRKERQRRVEMT